MAVFDVPATELIEAIAVDLKKQVKQPDWADFVKSGMHRERAPHRRDWFFVRMASVLYRVYKNGNLGTNRLRTYYGGRRSRGTAPHHVFKASGKVIRLCLQELEKLGLLKKEKKGRKISSRGESYLNTKAKEVKKLLEEKATKEREAKAVEKPREQQETVEREEQKKSEKPVQETKPAEKQDTVKKEAPEKEAGEKK